MTKGKLDTVRELINLGRLAEARAILETINTPEAHDLLRKITALQHDRLYQSQPLVPKHRKRDRSASSSASISWRIGGLVMAAFIVAAIFLFAAQQLVKDKKVTLPTEPPPTLYELPAAEISPTPTEIPASVSTAPSIPTQTLVPSTFTPTPAPTFEMPTPLPTITGTITPSDSTPGEARAINCPQVDLLLDTCSSALVDQGLSGEKHPAGGIRQR